MRLLPLLGASLVAASTAPDFDWDAVTPTRHLEYHDCYDSLQCARLELPLDWLKDADNRTVAIAMVKLPAAVPDDDPAFGGSIFTNPGGPGQSGVSWLRMSGRKFRYLVDKPGKRHYEIVSFDPRGVANSWPAVNCFPGNALARDAVALQARGNGAIDSGPTALAFGLSLSEAVAQRCKAHDQTADGESRIIEYMNTPSVARDMVAMVDKIDELRKQNAADKASSTGGLDPEQARLELRNAGVGADLPRLQYFGMSYGTVLGNYFASLFPGRVGRMALDGVVDAYDYSSGPGWLTGISDSEEFLHTFFKGCHEAGPKKCDLANAEDSSAADIEHRFQAWVDELKERPLPATLPSDATLLITAHDIFSLIAAFLYSPISTFKTLATTIASAMDGNTTDLIRHSLSSNAGFPPLDDTCTGDVSKPRPSLVEGTWAIACGDGDSIPARNATWYREYLDRASAVSPSLGTWWTMATRLPCAGWAFEPNWAFKGPFKTPEATRSGSPLEPGRPAAPLLFLSSRLDNVTPLRSARAMAQYHPGSGLVVQEGMGHCTYGNGASDCTKRAMANYFDSGEVPDGEVSCEISCGAWDDDCKEFLDPEATGASMFHGVL